MKSTGDWGLLHPTGRVAGYGYDFQFLVANFRPQRRLTVPQLGEVKGWVSFTSSLVLTLSGSLFLTREPCWGSYG